MFKRSGAYVHVYVYMHAYMQYACMRAFFYADIMRPMGETEQISDITKITRRTVLDQSE